MKNIIIHAFLLMVAFFSFTCSSNQAVHKKSDLPDWYLNTPEEEDYLYGIGESEGPDLGLTRISAEAAARDDIVRQISLKVNNMVKTSKQKVGQGGDAESASIQQSASNQVASQVIQNCKITKKHIETDGGRYKVYALAKISLISVREGIKEGLKDEDIKRQLKIGTDLQDLLDKEIDKMDGRLN